VAPSPVAWPFHLGDHGLFAIEQREDDLLAFARGLLEGTRIVDHLLHPLDVAAGGKRASCSRQHHDVDLRILVEVDEDPCQLLVHALIHGI